MNNQTLIENILNNCSYDTTNKSVAWTDCAVGTIGTVNDAYVRKDDFDVKMNELARKPEVPVETKTKLSIDKNKVYISNYEDGFFKNKRCIISDIKDVKIYKNVVMVTFADNTITKAVLDPEDKFNLEQGISICITKKLLGSDGSSIYNKLINRALKVKEQNEKAAEQAKNIKAEEKKRRELALARHQKKKAKKRAEKVSIYTEALVNALNDVIDKCKGKNNDE